MASTETSRRAAVISVIGSLNVDLVSYTSRIPNGGETLTSDSFSTNWGGKGANQAVAAARLGSGRGVNVKMIGAVGDDSFGPDLRKAMEGKGVDTTDVRVANGLPSGTAVILVESSTGENRILINPGANGTVLPTTLPSSLFPSTESSAPSIIIMQLEIPLQTVLHVCSEASKNSIPVILNPAPAIELPASLYSNVELLIVNETEATILSDVVVSSESGSAALVSDAHRAAAWFMSRGSQSVIITLGAFGVVVACMENGNQESSWVPAVKVDEVVDTTAAGDTFIGAVAVSLARRWSGTDASSRNKLEIKFEHLVSAVEYAVKASAWTVARKGTWEAMPSAEDVPL